MMMLKKEQLQKASGKKLAMLLAVGLASLGGVAVLSRSRVARAAPKALCGSLPVFEHPNGDQPNDDPFVAIVTLGVAGASASEYRGGTDDGLWFCLDSCCHKLNNAGCDDYRLPGQNSGLYLEKTDYFLTSFCGLPNPDSIITVAASGSDAWRGRLESLFGENVHRSMVLSTDANDELLGRKAERGYKFKYLSGNWRNVGRVPFDWWPLPWNVKLTTSNATYARSDDGLWFCVDSCCEKLNNKGIDDYEGYVPDYFFSKCETPKDTSTLKLVASGSDAWMGHLNVIYDQIVERTSQPLLLSTDPNDEISGIKAKRGVTLKKEADGQWHYAEDVAFDWFPHSWNVKLNTSYAADASSNDPLWFCVDDFCCDKLDNVGVDDYETGHIPDHFFSTCEEPLDTSTIKLVASGGDAWMGCLQTVYGAKVANGKFMLSTQPSDKIDGTYAKRGVALKKQADGHWHYDEDVPFSWFPWSVQLATSDVKYGGSNDPLYFCVDGCCEELDNVGVDDYRRGKTEHFMTRCAAPKDWSTLKLVASGGDAWMGHLNVIFDQIVEHTSLPLVLSTQSSDILAGIEAKRGVAFKKQTDGHWHYDEDVPFDYLLWNVKLATTDVGYAGMDGSLKFCVDSCCENLNNAGEDNYERGQTDYFVSQCQAPRDASTIKLKATSGDMWMGSLLSVYGADVVEYPLLLSTQSTDEIGGTYAKRGAVFKKGADGQWHFDEDMPF